jgi:hypothetical protein
MWCVALHVRCSSLTAPLSNPMKVYNPWQNVTESSISLRSAFILVTGPTDTIGSYNLHPVTNKLSTKYLYTVLLGDPTSISYWRNFYKNGLWKWYPWQAEYNHYSSLARILHLLNTNSSRQAIQITFNPCAKTITKQKRKENKMVPGKTL